MYHKLRTKWLVGVVLVLCLISLGGQSNFIQGGGPEYPLGDIPLDAATYQKYLRVTPLEMAGELPSAYDARAQGIVTSAKNQGACGSCWAFASVGALESHLLKAGYAFSPQDLSEQQQVSCNGSMSGCCGGSSTAIRFWETTGPLYEGCFPYGDGSTSCPTYSKIPCSNGAGCQQLPYRVTGFHTVPTSTQDFKQSLYTYGPSYWRFTVYTDFDTFWSSGQPGQVYVNTGGTVRGGHAVLLIGWDDSKAAFLCKNSWGSGGPNRDGTFWIAYTGHANNLGFGMANFSVTSLVCYSNADCNDGNACTDDVCVNPGQPNASCTNTWKPCSLAARDGCCGPTCTPSTDLDCTCGNNVCDGNGEDCKTCPADCPSGTGGTCSACFKGKCDGSCNPAKEGPDCADCAPGWCCGDGTCSAGESGSCPVDCPAAVCGDGVCNGDETKCTCPGDCGEPPGTEAGLCKNGVDDDCDGKTDCDDPDCSADPVCTCLAKGVACTADSQCCSNKCRGGVCR